MIVRNNFENIVLIRLLPDKTLDKIFAILIGSGIPP